MQCATFSKSLNPRNIDKSVSDIRILIRFPFESRFWTSVFGGKLTILPDIQPANRIADVYRNRISGLESGRIQHISNKPDQIRTTVLLKFPDQDQEY